MMVVNLGLKYLEFQRYGAAWQEGSGAVVCRQDSAGGFRGEPRTYGPPEPKRVSLS
jgi:hypothetical protein